MSPRGNKCGRIMTSRDHDNVTTGEQVRPAGGGEVDTVKIHIIRGLLDKSVSSPEPDT